MNVDYRAQLKSFIGTLQDTGMIEAQEQKCFLMSAYGAEYR
jgi:hypothetical protein